MTEGRPTTISLLLDSRQPKAGRTKLVGIDGHGGSGKSTLALMLAEQLGAETIHTDDFASWDNPKDWWPLLIERVLDPIREGAHSLSYPRSQWWPDHQPPSVVNQPVTPVMILEGVSALRVEFRRYLTTGVFVSAPRAVCLERGIRRDADQGTPDEISRLWEQYYADEESYLSRDDPQAYADIVVDGTQPFESQVLVSEPRFSS
jgi:uridine kinase